MVFKSGRQAEAPGALAINSGSAPVTACTLSTTRSRIRRPPTASRPLGTPPYRLAAPPARTAPRIDLEAMVFDGEAVVHDERDAGFGGARLNTIASRDRKSTRLNSSHVAISYAVFC